MGDEAVEIEALLERLRGGEQGALGELFSKYQPQLRRMVELRLDRRLGGRVAASDVLQEAYIDAAERWRHYFEKAGMSFYVWLRLIVNQSLVDVHRRHLGAKMRAAGMEVPVAGGAVSGCESACLAREFVARLESPSATVRQAELLGHAEAALEGMDPIDREILTLRHFEELTNNEVAELLGLAKAAASNRYVRALGRLKEALAEVPGFFEE
jgi:RNA polymerase sigma-70 factor (ECF subfamily)